VSWHYDHAAADAVFRADFWELSVNISSASVFAQRQTAREFDNRNRAKSGSVSFTAGRRYIQPAQCTFLSCLERSKEREKEHILKVFHSFMERHNIRYLTGGGLIIGTMRHHGMVPWDGDVDIGVAKGDQAALEKAVSEDSAFLTRHSIVTLPFRKSPLHRGHDGMFFMTSASQHPETHVYGHPVPVVEVYLVPSEGGHWMPKYCNHPPRMRLLFNQGGVAFWTCQKMIDAKYRIVASGYASATGGGTSLRPPELLLNEKSGCKAAWNHPSLNDVLNGSHLNAT